MTAEQAFDNHHKAVYCFVYRLAGRADLAEDITQDCFLALLRQPQGWDASRGGMTTYLFAVARNLAFKRFRDDHAGAQVDEELAGSIPDRRLDQELSLAVAQLVGLRPALQREVKQLVSRQSRSIGGEFLIQAAAVALIFLLFGAPLVQTRIKTSAYFTWRKVHLLSLLRSRSFLRQWLFRSRCYRWFLL